MNLLHLLAILSALEGLPAQLNIDQHAASSPVESMDMFQCYARYVSAPLEDGVLILHSRVDDVSRYIQPVTAGKVVVNLKEKDIGELGKDWHYQLIIIVATEIQDILNLLEDIYMETDCNVRSRYLVVYLGDADPNDIFRQAWKNYMVNIAVLQRYNTTVFTYFPYETGKCGEPIRVQVLGQCQHLSLESLYPEKVPKVFNGCLLRITSDHHVPGTVRPENSTSDPKIAGYEVVIVHTMAARFNLTTTVNMTRTDLKNGAYFVPLWNLDLNVSDLFHSAMHKLDTSGTLYETTHVYNIDYLVWHVPLALPGAQWKSIILVFQDTMWYAVLGFFVCNTVGWWMIGRASNVADASYMHSVLGSLVVLLNGSVQFPKQTSMRFVVVAWTLCSLLLIAAYQSKFLGILLKCVYEKQIANEQDLLDSNLTIYVYPFQTVTFTDRQSITDRITTITWSEYLHYIYSNFTKPAAFLHPLLESKYIAKYAFNDAKRVQNVYVFKESVESLLTCLYFRKGHPMYDQWNDLLMRVVSSGIVQKLIVDMDNTRRDIPSEPEHMPINMRHLSCAFFILIIGISVALPAFLLEHIIHKVKRRIEGHGMRAAKQGLRI